MYGGFLILNGTDSRENRYKCGPENSTSALIIKNLIISSLFAPAYISCEIRFTSIQPGRTGMHTSPTKGSYSFPATGDGLKTDSVPTITMKNLSFVQSGVTCDGTCNLEVENSSFDQSGVTCNYSCSVKVLNSTFANPTMVPVQSGVACYDSCRLEVVDTVFVQASLICNGACSMNVSNSNFTNSTVITDVNTGQDSKVISITHSRFIRKRSQPFIKFRSRADFVLEIDNCTFRDNHSLPFPDYLIDVNSSSLSVGRVVFHRNNFITIFGHGINLCGCFKSISLENLSIINVESFILKVSDKTSSTCRLRRVTVQMNNCSVHGTIASKRANSPAIDIAAREMKMSMNYMQFHSNNRSLISFSANNGNLTINNSDFADNSKQDVSHLLSISPYKERNNPPKTTKGEQDSVAGSIFFNLQGTKFSRNRVLKSIITLEKTSAALSNVTFSNNTVEGLGGDIHIKDHVIVILNNSRFERYPRDYFASAFVYSDVNSNSSVNITNCRFKSHFEVDASVILFLRSGISLRIDKKSDITCPLGYFFENAFNVSLSGSTIEDTYKLTCKRCSDGLYNLQQVYAILDISDTSVDEQCIPCPYGGNCTREIEAKPNFWGYLEPKDRRPTVKFEICPLGYCEPSPRSFNSCHGYRTGFLCGQCREGYTEAMFSSECHEEENCHNNWFWFFSLVYITCLSFLLITRPCIFQILWRNAAWFRPKNHGRQPLQSLHSSDEQHYSGKHFDHALVKTIFYFYQTVELLLISTSPEDLMNKVTFVRPFISLFNFEIWKENFGCPFPGLTAVIKRLFSSLTVFGTIACISLICISHKAMSYNGCVDHPRVNLYLAAIVETLLLGYEKLTDVSLNLMNCIQVKSEWRLFLDGNILCWQWWQHALLSFIMVFVVPFIFVLFWGSKKLNERKISTRELTMACILPLPFLHYWVVQLCIKKEPTQVHLEGAEEIKEVLHEPFRPPDEDDEGTLYWESVLIARRLVLLCLHSFLADPMLRLLCLTFACLAILLHHLYKRPFRDPIANACETFSLIALVIISTFSLAEASLVSEGTEIGGPRENVFKVLQWIELALLGVVPACLFMLVSLVVLSQLFRLFFHVVMWDQRQPQRLNRVWHFPVDSSRPLLYSSPAMY